MTSKITAIGISSLLTLTILTACGEEAVTTPEVQQYAEEQAQTDTQTASTPVKTSTTKTPATTTTGKTTTATKPATTTGKTTTGATATVKVDATAGLSIAQKLMNKTKQVYDGLQNYSATIIMYSKRNDTVSPKANPVINMEFKYSYMPPRKSVFNVVKHNISMVIGAKMIWDGGDTARVKASGVLGLFPMDMKLSDSKMSTNREWTFSDLDHVGILKRVFDPKATLELAGKTTANGKEAYMIKVKNVGLDSEITEENIAIDAKSFMILADEMYAGDTLAFQLKMNVEGVNTNLAANTFTLD